MDRGVSYLQAKVKDKVMRVEKTNERKIQESGSVWYNPFTWGSVITRTVRETTVREVIQQASLWNRFLFGFVYAALRCLQYLYYTTFALVVVRSFGYVLARAAVRRGKGFDFTLPPPH
jgi:hypothetical protein